MPVLLYLCAEIPVDKLWHVVCTDERNWLLVLILQVFYGCMYDLCKRCRAKTSENTGNRIDLTLFSCSLQPHACTIYRPRKWPLACKFLSLGFVNIRLVNCSMYSIIKKLLNSMQGPITFYDCHHRITQNLEKERRFFLHLFLMYVLGVGMDKLVTMCMWETL